MSGFSLLTYWQRICFVYSIIIIIIIIMAIVI